jgi:hypothetical protein
LSKVLLTFLAKYHIAGARMHQPVMKVLLVQNSLKDDNFNVHQQALDSNPTVGTHSANHWAPVNIVVHHVDVRR